MSKVKIMSMLCRMFSTKHDKAFAGIRNRVKLLEQNEPVDIENIDAQDLSEYETDFMSVGESHKMHKKEMAWKKEHLKSKIVTKKYFKENEPRFLTFAEKELIRTLHENNPEEWPIERLSESFPALPETIHKILRTKWLPKSVEKVMQYDKVVIENWKKYRTGKLALNPILDKHLSKFKDRKIISTDRELLAKQFVLPKPVFKQPRSQLFKNIIQDHLSIKQDAKLLSQENNSSKMLDISKHSDKTQNLLIANTATNANVVVNNVEKFTSNEEKSLTLKLQSSDLHEKYSITSYKKKNDTKQSLTFNEFIKTNLKDMSKMSPEEGSTLLDVYKQMIANQEMQTTITDTISSNAMTDVKKDSAVSKNTNCDSDVSTDENLMDTHIIVWKKKLDVECDYAKPIKITKNIYKPGMTYRISDCYYDDDGEFLYRVPGVQS